MLWAPHAARSLVLGAPIHCPACPPVLGEMATEWLHIVTAAISDIGRSPLLLSAAYPRSVRIKHDLQPKSRNCERWPSSGRKLTIATREDSVSSRQQGVVVVQFENATRGSINSNDGWTHELAGTYQREWNLTWTPVLNEFNQSRWNSHWSAVMQ